MARFATMFTPSLASLAAGVQPASWMMLVDEGQTGRDQLIQRAASKTAQHLGMEDHTYGPREDGEGNGLSFYLDIMTPEPIGTISWVESPLDLALAA